MLQLVFAVRGAEQEPTERPLDFDAMCDFHGVTCATRKSMSIELADELFLLSAVFDFDFFVVHVTACFLPFVVQFVRQRRQNARFRHVSLFSWCNMRDKKIDVD